MCRLTVTSSIRPDLPLICGLIKLINYTSIRFEFYVGKLFEKFVIVLFRKQLGNVDFGGSKRLTLTALGYFF